MRIYRAKNKRKYLPLLLLADEQESMIEKYIDGGVMYVLEADGRVAGEILVTDIGGGVLEIKNLAVDPKFQRKGYGKTLIDFVCDKYSSRFSVVQVGTGDSPLTIPFYEKCGFEKFGKIENFFTDNYDKPIIECGVVLRDMIYLRKNLRG